MTLLKKQVAVLEKFSNYDEKLSGVNTINLNSEQFNCVTTPHLIIGMRDYIPLPKAKSNPGIERCIGDTDDYSEALVLPSIKEIRQFIKDSGITKNDYKTIKLTSNTGQLIYVNPFFLRDCLVALHVPEGNKSYATIDPNKYHTNFSCSPIWLCNSYGFMLLLPCRV